MCLSRTHSKEQKERNREREKEIEREREKKKRENVSEKRLYCYVPSLGDETEPGSPVFPTVFI